MATGSSSGWSSALDGGADTVVAPATPPGRGALAVVRMSGADAFAVAVRVCPDLDVADDRRAQLVAVVDGGGETVDRGIVIPYRGPRSYTGEDTVEIVVHGAPVVVEGTVAACIAAGARPARPGEFSQRAVANGKLDLVQAEAIHDLVQADTVRQARAARRQREGALSARFEAVRERLVAAAAVIEAAIDFTAQGVEYDEAGVTAELAACRGKIGDLVATAARGRRLREGATVVLAGPPNAGKSTLFNLLLAEERAIVSPEPGTTRDLVSGEVEIAGVPVRLVDTAGRQASRDPVEREGVRRAAAVTADADAVVQLWPADEPGPPDGWPEAGEPGVVRVRSKADLDGGRRLEEGEISVSAVDGRGLEELRRAIGGAVGVGGEDGAPDVLIGERHRRLLVGALAELEEAPTGEPEIAAAAVRRALGEVEAVVGRVADGSVLDEIFRRFCLGK